MAERKAYTVTEPNTKTAEAARQEVRPYLQKMEGRALQKPVAPVLEIVAVAAVVLKQAQKDLAQMKKKIVSPPEEQMALLQLLPLALWAVQVELERLRAMKDPENRKKLLAEGYMLQQLLGDAARYLWKRSKKLWPQAQKILQGRGHRDMVRDLPAYVALFRQNWADAHGNCRVRETHLTRAEELAPILVEFVTPEKEDATLQEALKERDQIWTLLLECYDEVARAGHFVYADQEVADELYPNLIGEANRLLAEDK